MNNQDRAKKTMPLEMQDIVAKTLFTGPPQPKAGRSKGVFGAPGGTVQTNWELEDHMIFAARVCKAWSQAYETHLETQTAKIFARAHQDAVSSALDLCDYSKYDDPYTLPTHAQVVHSIYSGGKLLFVMRFKRTQVGRLHELEASYAVGARVSACAITVSPLCCVADRNRDWWQKEFFRGWRALQTAALDQWLGEQHAAFHGEGQLLIS
jgi:hypothetical protein